MLELSAEDFCTHWRNLVGNANQQVKVVLAFSGGVDSMSLLDLLSRLPLDARPQLHLAYFNHQLREDSPAEETFVRQQAQRYEVGLTVGHWTTDHTARTEAAARQARYNFLGTVLADQSAEYLLTAHHADDLLETIIMKLIRSGAIGELPGLKEKTAFNGAQLLRPLLPYDKQQLYAYAKSHQLAFVEDQTNQTDFTMRNRLRHHFVPDLKAENDQLLAHSQRFANELVATQKLASMQIQSFFKEMAVQQSSEHIMGALPQLSLSNHEWQLLWSTFWQTYLPDQPLLNLGQLAQIAQLSRQPTGHHQIDLADQWQFTQSYGRFEISRQSQDSKQNVEIAKKSIALELDQWCQVSDFRIGVFRQLPADYHGEIVATFQTVQDPERLILRHPVTGDRVVLANGQQQKLRRRMIDSKVPVTRRNSLWLLQVEDLIVWVENIYNYKLSNGPETAKIIYVLVDH